MANIARVYKDNGMMPEWEDRQFDRKRKLAEALQAQSMEMPQGQMVSGHYVAANPLQYMAKMLQGYNAKKDLEGYDKQQQDAVTQQRDKVAQAVKGFGEVYNPNQMDVSQSEIPQENADGSTSYGATPMMDNKAAAYAYLLENPDAASNPLIAAQIPSLTPKAPEDFTLAPGAVRYSGSKVVAANEKPADNKPLIVGSGSTVLDPVTHKPLYTAPAKAEYKQRKFSPDGVHYVDQESQDGGKTWQQVGAPVPIRSTVANVSANAINAGPKAFDTEISKLDAQRLDTLRSTAAEASNILETTANMKEALKKGVYSGGGANAKAALANYMSGIFGMEESKRLIGSQQFSAETGKLVLAKIKQLGANPSNADRDFIEKTVPQLEQSAAARASLIDFLEKKAKQQLTTYKRADAYARKNKGLGGFDEFDNGSGWEIKEIP